MKNIQEGNSKNTPRLQFMFRTVCTKLYSIFFFFFFKHMKTGSSPASSEDPDKCFYLALSRKISSSAKQGSL